MSVLAVIPARLGATRLARKPLRLVGGEPLVVRVLQRVAGMAVVDAVVVATDSEEIASAVRAAGGQCELTDAGHPSGTDRVAEVASRRPHLGHAVILNVQGDEPFVSEAAITGAVDLVRSGRFPLGTAAAPDDPAIRLDPDVVKVVCADDDRALYFSRAPIPWMREPADGAIMSGLVRRHIGVYACAPAALRQWVSLPVHPLERLERLEQLRPLAAGMPMGVARVDAPLAGGVDTEDDLVRANAHWNDLYAGRT